MYKEMYIYSFEQRESLNGRVSIPAGIVPLLIAGLIYLLDNLEDITGFWWVIAVISLCGYSLFLVSTLILIFKTLYGYQYGYLPLPNEIETYRLQCIRYYENEDEVNEKLDEFFIQEYLKWSNLNIKSNRTKLRYLRFASYSFIFTLIFGAICILPFTIGKSNSADIQKVKIISVGGAVYDDK